MFDSHCHLDFESLSEDLPAHVSAAGQLGVQAWLVPGCFPEQWNGFARLRELASERGWEVHFAVGLHPWWTEGGVDPERLAEEVYDAARRCGAVALGELGYDKNRGADLEVQTRIFESQLQVAHQLELPAVFHCVGRAQELLASLKRVGLPKAGAVLHGFGGDLGFAEALIRRGVHLGIGPQVMRKGRERLRDVVREVDLSSLILETDAPDQRLFPDSSSGMPRDLAAICGEVAELKGLTEGEVGATTERSTRLLFGLPPRE